MDTETATNPVDGEDTASDTLTATRESRPKARLPRPELDEDGNPVEPPSMRSEEVELDGLKLKVPKEGAKLKGRFPPPGRLHPQDAGSGGIAQGRRGRAPDPPPILRGGDRRPRATCGRSTSSSPITSGSIGTHTSSRTLSRLRPSGASFSSSKRPRQQAPANTRSSYSSALAAQQETAKRIDEGRAVLAREIPGWGPEKAKAALHRRQGIRLSAGRGRGINLRPSADEGPPRRAPVAAHQKPKQPRRNATSPRRPSNQQPSPQRPFGAAGWTG
jgi:hypothetical protein